MKVEVFEMERFQSIWENQVTHNMSESGVHPLFGAPADRPANPE